MRLICHREIYGTGVSLATGLEARIGHLTTLGLQSLQIYTKLWEANCSPGCFPQHRNMCKEM